MSTSNKVMGSNPNRCSHGWPMTEYCSLCFRASALAGEKDPTMHPMYEPSHSQSDGQTEKFYEEFDPNGTSQHAPGAKLDAGKNRLSLIMGGFALALYAVGEVGTYGAEKYTDDGWVDVPNGVQRYTDAMYRHLLAETIEGVTDQSTGLSHAAQAAWNALARLELMLRQKEPL